MARALGEAGAAVWLNARDPQALAAKCGELQLAGIAAAAAPFDVTDEAAVIAATARIVAERGRLDILIANARILARKPVLEHPTARFTAAVPTDLTARSPLAREA